ncbi:phosphatidylinositol glycan anchor biosynthesis class U protein-like protein [Leptotrombidium deliense]|uniref:Phosphatidylinositol glycan anchor biosynthesis class U protein-like protein n=1 Tax=Leptotrombidium deliense TaxID=299467 RepID=A0A443SLR0_9ACAR|nr:phosphatidylinositol glycan anchor biosynthesis class U protein-like protein [Leptotrombidium deliense]
MHFRVLAFVLLAIVIRLLLVNSSYRNEISERVEISTPTNSWKRGIEGIDLLRKGISPYSGDTFHETPIFLLFYSMLNELNEISINILYVMCDTATAVCLGLVCYVQLFDNSNNEITLFEKLKKEDRKELRIETENLKHLAISVTCVYLLCPYSILVCVAKTTSVFSNLLMSLLLLSISYRRRLLSCVLLALLTYQSLYPIMMLVPVVMAIEQSSENGKCGEKYRFKSIISTLTMFTTSLSILLVTSYFLCGQSWRLTVPDFTPNIGLFWYFFTEMFDHFRDFFVWTFQINSFLYVIPLALTLRKDPNFLSFILLVLMSLFKPYPSISDFSLYLSLLPQWSHLFKCKRNMKQGLVVVCMILSCSVLAPIMWHMWIVLGTANSNYFFGVTLAYNTAQILLLTDLLFAFTKRQFYLNEGLLKDENGKHIQLELAY